MTRLVWGAVGERFFEAGVDRGVLYVGNNPGVAWNGLVSVNESPTGGDSKGYYLDGVKYFNKATAEEFEATLEAYTYPDEFGPCDGTASVKYGLFATQQSRVPFSLAYRTQIGNDTEGAEHAYKIHLVYDALASPSSKSHASMGSSIEPFNFSWKITTRPPLVRGYRRTAHFVIDSRDTPVDLLQEIEDILYGNEERAPRIPVVHELIYMFSTYGSGVFDARIVGQPYYNTFDGGNPPTEVQTATINGGAP